MLPVNTDVDQMVYLVVGCCILEDLLLLVAYWQSLISRWLTDVSEWVEVVPFLGKQFSFEQQHRPGRLFIFKQHTDSCNTTLHAAEEFSENMNLPCVMDFRTCVKYPQGDYLPFWFFLRMHLYSRSELFLIPFRWVQWHICKISNVPAAYLVTPALSLNLKTHIGTHNVEIMGKWGMKLSIIKYEINYLLWSW